MPLDDTEFEIGVANLASFLDCSGSFGVDGFGIAEVVSFIRIISLFGPLGGARYDEILSGLHLLALKRWFGIL